MGKTLKDFYCGNLALSVPSQQARTAFSWANLLYMLLIIAAGNG